MASIRNIRGVFEYDNSDNKFRGNNGRHQDRHADFSHQTGPEEALGIAEQEHLSIANMVEVMILGYCGGMASRFPNRAKAKRERAVQGAKWQQKQLRIATV